MDYPTREQITKIFEYCLKIDVCECETCDIKKYCGIIDDPDIAPEIVEAILIAGRDKIDELESANQQLLDEANSLKEEIDRLTALVPKVVGPKAVKTTDGRRVNNVFACDCFQYVVDSTDKYCHTCGATLDWDKVEK